MSYPWGSWPCFYHSSSGSISCLEVNAFVLPTSALVSVNALAQAEHLEAGILWPGPGSLPSSHTCHRASAFPVSAKPFLVSVSEIATMGQCSLLSYLVNGLGKWPWWKLWENIIHQFDKKDPICDLEMLAGQQFQRRCREAGRCFKTNEISFLKYSKMKR